MQCEILCANVLLVVCVGAASAIRRSGAEISRTVEGKCEKRNTEDDDRGMCTFNTCNTDARVDYKEMSGIARQTHARCTIYDGNHGRLSEVVADSRQRKLLELLEAPLNAMNDVIVSRFGNRLNTIFYKM